MVKIASIMTADSHSVFCAYKMVALITNCKEQLKVKLK